jgi:hypothetical protein
MLFVLPERDELFLMPLPIALGHFHTLLQQFYGTQGRDDRRRARCVAQDKSGIAPIFRGYM